MKHSKTPIDPKTYVRLSTGFPPIDYEMGQKKLDRRLETPPPKHYPTNIHGGLMAKKVKISQ